MIHNVSHIFHLYEKKTQQPGTVRQTIQRLLEMHTGHSGVQEGIGIYPVSQFTAYPAAPCDIRIGQNSQALKLHTLQLLELRFHWHAFATA